MSKWIPCSKRLPEDSRRCIVTFKVRDSYRVETSYYDKGVWYDVPHLFEAVAWQYLPEPYTGETK